MSNGGGEGEGNIRIPVVDPEVGMDGTFPSHDFDYDIIDA